VLVDEAKWLGAWLAAQPPEAVYPLCNLGSSTKRFRTVTQPWIDAHLFAPARGEVIHVDRKADDGVDLVGDITDPAFAGELRRRSFQTVLCSNLLEHVDDLAAACALVWSLVPPGGQLVVTGPYRYPIHLDPIDNGLRASPDELAAMFPGAVTTAGAVIRDGTFARYLFRSPGNALDEILRVFTPFVRPRSWLAGMRRWGWLHRRFAASGVVLQRPA
jgi:SAM-dependent methyltransferase